MTEERKSKPKARKERKSGAPKKVTRLMWAARAGVAVVFLLSLGLLGLVGIFSYYGRSLPTVDKLEKYDPPQTTRVVDRKGRLIAELFEERRSVVPMKRIPRVVVLSVLAAEDADFYLHRGLDYAGILRALWLDAMHLRASQGASTITQQIVKNLLLTPERTIARKVKELILARRLEQELTKDQILHLYLNHINFGHGRYGVQEAARFYFGKDVSKLDLAEASMMAGLPQAPSRLSPLKHPQAAKERQSYVLDQLARKREQYWDDLPLAEIEKARTEPLKFAGEQAPSTAAPEVAALATQLLENLVGPERAKRGGFRVETTIDLDLQRKVRSSLRDGLVAIDTRHKLIGPLTPPKKPVKLDRVPTLMVGRNYPALVTGARDKDGLLELNVGGHRALAPLSDAARQNPEHLAPSAFAPPGVQLVVAVDAVDTQDKPARVRPLLGPDGAVVVIDPRTREVQALVGGWEEAFGFDRALQAVRQPGSSWKPITYALAIESKKYTPASMVLDAPEVFDQWKPDNYETWSYAGALRLRDAVAQSVNLVAVRVMNDMTPPAVVDFARKLGITTDLDPSLALALGASGVKPIELVNAYATFAAGGCYEPYRLIRSITDSKGKKVPLKDSGKAQQVLSPAAAYVLTSMLRSVIEEGTAKAAAHKLGRPAAGKTGTSNNARDAWFVGYTPDAVAGVWVGYDDQRPLGRGESGAKAALPIWMDVMKSLTDGRPAAEFPVPPGVEHVRIDKKTGKRAYDGIPDADALDEVFLEGTAPTETALPPDMLDTGSFVMEQLGGVAPPTPPH